MTSVIIDAGPGTCEDNCGDGGNECVCCWRLLLVNLKPIRVESMGVMCKVRWVVGFWVVWDRE